MTHPSANLTNHPTAPTLRFLVIIIIFLLQVSLSEKLLIQRAETSPYYSNLWKDHLISRSIYQVFLLSVTLRHRQSSVIIWCFGSSVWNLNLKKVLNHGCRMGEVVPTYINGFKTPRNIFVRWLQWCSNDRSSASLCETSFSGQSLINEIKHRDKLRKWGL